MRHIHRFALLAGFVPLLLLGCGQSDGGTSSEREPKAAGQRILAERVVKGGLDRTLDQLVGKSAEVGRVRCIHADGPRYECVAQANEPIGSEETKTVPVLVDATCDSQNCIWRVSDIGVVDTRKPGMPSPESMRTFHNPSLSMEPTLKPSQAVEVDLGAYESVVPTVGDIVIFHPPEGVNGSAEERCAVPHPARQACPLSNDEAMMSELFIKRVVAGSGDRLAVRDGHVVLNGVTLNEDYIRPCPSCDLPIPIEVPSGYVFLMGDNRGASDDSQFWGPIPRGWVVGKVVNY